MFRRWKLPFVLTTLVLFAVCCAQRRNASGRIGHGAFSRSNGSFDSLFTNGSATGTGQPSSQADMVAFFSNFANQDGTPFTLPCTVNSLNVLASVSAALDPSGFSSVSVPSTGGSLHVNFNLACSSVDRSTNRSYNSIRVDIADTSQTSAQTSGWVEGSQASLTFQDDDGSITLVGSISGGQFSGTMTFNNAYAFGADGKLNANGQSGTLGTFSINACTVFSCP